MLRDGISAEWPVFGEIDRICSRRIIGGFRYKATVGWQSHLLSHTVFEPSATLQTAIDNSTPLGLSRDVRPSRGAKEYVGDPFMQIAVAKISDAVGARGSRLWWRGHVRMLLMCALRFAKKALSLAD